MLIAVLRLKPGDDLRASLERDFQSRGLRAACIVSAIGSLSRASLRYAGRDEATVIVGDLELLTLAGTLSLAGAHLHASVSDAHGQVMGGHMLAGCVVRTTAEVVLGVLEDWEFTREQDPATGYKELKATRLP